MPGFLPTPFREEAYHRTGPAAASAPPESWLADAGGRRRGEGGRAVTVSGDVAVGGETGVLGSACSRAGVFGRAPGWPRLACATWRARHVSFAVPRHSRHPPSPTRHPRPVTLSAMPWIVPPTLYKARNVPHKQPVCAICVDRTRGPHRAGAAVPSRRRVAVRRSCEPRRSRPAAAAAISSVRWPVCGRRTTASPPPATARSPRTWSAWPNRRRNGRGRAATRGPSCVATSSAVTRRAPRRPRSRPPSTRAFADCPARPPSRRTIQRWHAQRRWLAHAP